VCDFGLSLVFEVYYNLKYELKSIKAKDCCMFSESQHYNSSFDVFLVWPFCM